jgi:hypothetical protein
MILSGANGRCSSAEIPSHSHSHWDERISAQADLCTIHSEYAWLMAPQSPNTWISQEGHKAVA